MRQATITLTALGDAHLRFPFSQELVDDLKAQIPAHCRAWTPQTKTWWIAASFVNLAARLAEGYFDVEHIDAPQARQRAYTAPPPRPLHPDPFATLHLLPSAPPELIEAAARSLAKLFHPDLKPEHEKALATAKMAQINRAVEDLRRRRGVA
ncbi:MAG: hypothetical protein JWM96_1324 [Alphaproteobacteria bacterium]|nr:hypothetical protein [Alphaproteobacteria bacterium]